MAVRSGAGGEAASKLKSTPIPSPHDQLIPRRNSLEQGRQPAGALLFHSDRGAQYASAEYRALLATYGLTASMSRPGNPYDNAQMESFFSTFKTECVHRHDLATHTQARAVIFDYLEVFYNRQRFHSALAYQSPVDFEIKNH